MRIGILGTGTMGMAVGRLFARSRHDVVFGSRCGARARAAAGRVPRASGSSYEGALVGSDLVAVAQTWGDVFGALTSAGSFDGRVLLDCTNPEPAEGRGLVVGHVTSGAELIAQAAPDARVVKALNHVYAETLDSLREGGPRPVAFLCGDDASARYVVAGLLEQAGLRPIDAGPLRCARYLEPQAALMVELVRGRGRAPVEAAGLTEAPATFPARRDRLELARNGGCAGA